MAILSATKKMFLTYYIVLTDAAEVARLQGLYPDGVNRAPYNVGPPAGGAAIEFSAPFKGYVEPKASLAPFIWTPWRFDASGGKPFPIDVATFTRHTGGFWGIGGTTVHYYWIGEFKLAGDTTTDATEGEHLVTFARRRWVEGFECPGVNSSLYVANVSPEASRHVGGLGFAYRGELTTASIATNIHGAATDATKTWERFYIRLRKLPTTTVDFWRWHGNPSAGAGASLGISPAGLIVVNSRSAAGGATLIDFLTPAIEAWTGLAGHNAWHRIDVIIQTAFDASNSQLQVYVDGALAGDFRATLQTSHVSSDVGGVANVANDLEIDIDEWIGAEAPIFGGVVDTTGVEFKNGSKVTRLRPSGFAASHSVNWAGDYRALIPAYQTTATYARLTTSTSGAVCAVTTDAESVLDNDEGALGIGGFKVGLYGFRGTTSGTLGYKLGAAAAVNTAIVEPATIGPNFLMVSPNAGLTAFADVTPTELYHTKGADVGAAAIQSLHAEVELIGRWGVEDYPEAERALAKGTYTGQHNGPYPRSPWAQRGLAAPISPYACIGGTYVGNGTGFDLTFPVPVHFVLIRPVVSASGFFWLPNMLMSSLGMQQQGNPSIVSVEEDPTFAAGGGEDAAQQRYRARIAGNNAGINTLGATYQYIAIGDPGMRFSLCMSSQANTGQTADRVIPLIVEGFTPTWAFVYPDRPDSGTATQQLRAKSLGQAARSGVSWAVSTLGDLLVFATGQVSTGVGSHTRAGGHTALMLWRRDDGSGDSGIPAAVCYGYWTGDGTASRTITTSPPTGKRPLFAFVFAGVGGSLSAMRDPSHTGTTSTNNDGSSNASTGITAGQIDGFSVGSALNTNGVAYAYFLIYADATAGNNGWGNNGTYWPVDPTMPGTGPWPADPGDEPGEPTGGGGGVPVPGAETDDPDDPTADLATDCLGATQPLVNRALQRIGVSVVIENLATDTTHEAEQARLIIARSLNQVLADFPWPFATKYAALSLVGGTAGAAVNAEWQYSYRRPTDCLFERRIIKARGGAPDPTPPPFSLGRDATGGLIFCNDANASLEYTWRTTCPARSHDVYFREAATWRLAASLAAPLGRMTEKVESCLKEYQAVLVQAESVLRPGTPGLLATVTDTESVLKLLLVNRALIRIGCRTIGNYLTDQSRAAVAAREVFDAEYASTLRDHPWSFATAYAALVLVDGAATGDPADQANPDWVFSYRVPTDAVAARRLVDTVTRRGWDPSPPKFRLGSDVVETVVGRLLFTDEEDATLEYTKLVTLSASDALFREALVWRLAAALALAVPAADPELPTGLGRGPDPNQHTAPEWRQPRPEAREVQRMRIAANALAMYRLKLEEARIGDATEQQQDPDGDAGWIAGRQ